MIESSLKTTELYRDDHISHVHAVNQVWTSLVPRLSPLAYNHARTRIPACDL